MVIWNPLNCANNLTRATKPVEQRAQAEYKSPQEALASPFGGQGIPPGIPSLQSPNKDSGLAS